MWQTRVGKTSQPRQQIDVTNRVEVLGVGYHRVCDHACDLRSPGLAVLQEFPVNVAETRSGIGVSGNHGLEGTAEKWEDYGLFSQEGEDTTPFLTRLNS